MALVEKPIISYSLVIISPPYYILLTSLYTIVTTGERTLGTRGDLSFENRRCTKQETAVRGRSSLERTHGRGSCHVYADRSPLAGGLCPGLGGLLPGECPCGLLDCQWSWTGGGPGSKRHL